MRLAAVLLVAVLVNLPFAHETWTAHEVSARGHEVTATVTALHSVRGRRLVEFRLPRSADPRRKTYTAQVDVSTYDVARETHRLRVRAVPGKPADNRPDGEVTSHLFLWVAAVTDVVLLLALALVLARTRRWRLKTVVSVDGDLVTFTMADLTLCCLAPGVAAVTGQPIRGSVHLEATGDVFPGVPVAVLEQDADAGCFVRGRVVDVDREHVDLQLDNGFVLRVLVGPWRNRADLRDHGEVSGTLVLTPR